MRTAIATIFTILLFGTTAIAGDESTPGDNDSIPYHEVHDLVVKKIVDPLEKCKKLRSTESFMDKTGHRDKVLINNFSIDLKNNKGGWIIVPSGQGVVGELKRVDGISSSHICSFKVDPKTKEIMARTTATSRWLSAKQFVKKVKKKSKKG